MRYLLILLLALSVANADYAKKKSLACPSVMLHQKAPKEQGDSGMDLTIYTIANNCEIVSRRDQIEAIGYDPASSHEIYQKIIYQRTGKELFMLRKNIFVEQGGKKNIFRF